MVLILVLSVLFGTVVGDNVLGLAPEQPTPNRFENPYNQIPVKVQNGGPEVSQKQPDCPNTAILLRILNVLLDLSGNGSNNIGTNDLMYVFELINNYFESSPRNAVNGELYKVFNNIKNIAFNSNVSSNKNGLIDSVEENKIKITVQYEIPGSLNCRDSFEHLFKLISQISENNNPGLTNFKIVSRKPKSVLNTKTPNNDKIIQDRLREEQKFLSNINNIQHNNNIMSILQNYRTQELQIADVDYGKNNEELHPSKPQLPYQLNLLKGFINHVQLSKQHEDSVSSINNSGSHYKAGELHSNMNYIPVPGYPQNSPNYEANAPNSNDENNSNIVQALEWKYPNSVNLITQSQSPYISNPNVLISENLSNSVPMTQKQSVQYLSKSNNAEVKYSNELKPSDPISIKKLKLATKPVLMPDTGDNLIQSNFGLTIYNHNRPQPNQYSSNPNQNAPNIFGSHLNSENRPHPYQDLNNRNENASNFFGVNLNNGNRPLPYLDLNNRNQNVPNVFEYNLNNAQPYQDPNNPNQNVPNVLVSHQNNENLQGQLIITSNVQNSPQNPYEFTKKSSDKNQPEQAAYVLNLPDSQHLNTEANFLNVKQTPHNDLVEITYVLQRPKRVQYEPLYLVKYRLPLKLYEESLNKLLTQKPNLRSDPNQLHQELLSTTNFTKSIKGAPGLKNKEVLDMISENGTFVGTKFLTSNSTAIESELNIIKELNSNLSTEDVLNINNGAAKMELEMLKHSPNDTENKVIDGQSMYQKRPSIQRSRMHQANQYLNYPNSHIQSPMVGSQMNNFYKTLSYKQNAPYLIPSLDLVSYFKNIKSGQTMPDLKPTLIYGR